MQTEEQCPPSQRYLLADTCIHGKALEAIKETCRAWKKGKRIDEPFQRFMRWQPSDHEIAIYTYYAYADFEIPKQFEEFLNQSAP